MRLIFNVADYDAVGDGIVLDTKALQAAIDAASLQASAECKAQVLLQAGTYLTSSLFLKSHIEFHMEEGAVLLGTTDESQYPLLRTRVAGIEMDWPAAILNINGQQNVKVTGKGVINGQGPYWWNKYWGEDKKGGMRKDYDTKGLRWCVDYDCKRVRNMVVMESRDIELSGFDSIRSGFWNIHLCYSENVHVDGLSIYDNAGPSTDGIDIDSCRNVVVEHCTVACNDDSICIKSGRDADGLRVGRICEDVVIKDCEILTGAGVTIGSETSGGARNILIQNLKYRNTDCGFRMKSAKTRGGTIENVLVENIQMVNVKYPFSMCLNWHPAYSYCELPKDYEGEIPDHWKTLTKKVDKEVGIPKVKNITIRNIHSMNEPDYNGPSRAFEIDAFSEKPMENVVFNNVKIQAKELGRIQGVKNMSWKDVEISIDGPNNNENDQYDNR
jgi:polygalacturonase